MRAEEAIGQLREAICAPARFEGVDPVSALSALHPLACPPTGQSRRKILQALSSLRTCLQLREQWERRTDSRDALLHVLRDMDKQRKNLTVAQKTLKSCLELARTQDPFATASAVTVARINAAAEAAGASTHEEPAGPSKGSLVSVCGTTFLADFQMHPDSAVADVKFRDLDANGTAGPGDRNVDEDFARLVADADFGQLEKAFRALTSIEALDSVLGIGVQLRRGLNAFENDLLAMQAAEVSAGCSPDVRKMHGHGLVKRCAHGLRIEYANARSVTLSAEDAPEPRRLILGSASPVAVPPPAAAVGAPLPPAFAFAPPPSALAPAHYVLVLDQPLAVTLKVAQELERIGAPAAGLKRPASSVSGGGGSQKPKRMREEDPFAGPFPSGTPRSGAALTAAAGVGRALPGHVDAFPSIQMLLAPKAFANEFALVQDAAAAADGTPDGVAACMAGPEVRAPPAVTAAARVGADGSGANLTAAARKSASGHVLSHELNEYVACVALPRGQHVTLSHNVSNLVAGVTVARVPVVDPSDVIKVFAALRQQIAFNELFVSCFGKPGGVGSSSSPLVEELVEVVLDNAPEFMHFAIFDARADGVVELGISVARDGTFAAKIGAPGGKKHPCSDEKATEILMQTRSVPMTIQSVTQIAIDAGPGAFGCTAASL